MTLFHTVKPSLQPKYVQRWLMGSSGYSGGIQIQNDLLSPIKPFYLALLWETEACLGKKYVPLVGKVDNGGALCGSRVCMGNLCTSFLILL